MTFIPLPILLPIVEVTMHSGTLTFSEGAFNVIHGIRGHKLHYSTFVIDMENKEIIDDKAIGSADSDISYAEFAAAVKSSAPCYAMIDFKCTFKNGVESEDIICVSTFQKVHRRSETRCICKINPLSFITLLESLTLPLRI